MANIQDELLNVGIERDVHCGNCGYNLRTRPLIGKCPECGNDYNSRSAYQEGIFRHGSVTFPAATSGLLLLCAGASWASLHQAVVAGVDWAYMPGAAFVLLGLRAVLTWIRQIRLYRRYCRVVRTVES